MLGFGLARGGRLMENCAAKALEVGTNGMAFHTDNYFEIIALRINIQHLSVAIKLEDHFHFTADLVHTEPLSIYTFIEKKYNHKTCSLTLVIQAYVYVVLILKLHRYLKSGKHRHYLLLAISYKIQSS